MRRLVLAAALSLGLCLGLSTPAAAIEVAGVQVPDTTTFAGKTLVLNGAGLRSKLFVKVYVGALYLEQRSGDAAAIVAADAPWKVVMTFKREVDKEKIIGAFKEGFENNSPADAASLAPALARVDATMKDLKEGDVLTIAYAPGTGSTITTPAGATVTIEGRAFGAALLRNWLGEKPADSGLKKGMLGK
jgi:hypothetical protein